MRESAGKHAMVSVIGDTWCKGKTLESGEGTVAVTAEVLRVPGVTSELSDYTAKPGGG